MQEAQLIQRTTAIQPPVAMQPMPVQCQNTSKNYKIFYIHGVAEIAIASICTVISIILGFTPVFQENFILLYIICAILAVASLFVTGGLGMCSKQRMTHCLILSNMVMAIITAVFIILFFGSCIILFVAVSNDHNNYSDIPKLLFVLNSVLSIFAFMIVIGHSVFCCKEICCRQRSNARYGGYVTSIQSPNEQGMHALQALQAILPPVAMQPMPVQYHQTSKNNKILFIHGVAEVAIASILTVSWLILIVEAFKTPVHHNFNLLYIIFAVLAVASLFVMGGVGMCLKQRKTKRLILTNMVMAISTAVFMILFLRSSIIGFIAVQHKHAVVATIFYVINSVLSFSALMIMIVHSVFCCQEICCRYQQVIQSSNGQGMHAVQGEPGNAPMPLEPLPTYSSVAMATNIDPTTSFSYPTENQPTQNETEVLLPIEECVTPPPEYQQVIQMPNEQGMHAVQGEPGNAPMPMEQLPTYSSVAMATNVLPTTSFSYPPEDQPTQNETEVLSPIEECVTPPPEYQPTSTSNAI